MSVFGAGRGNVQRDPIELALFGNEADRVYQIDNSDAKGQGFASVSLSGALPFEIQAFDAFAVGATVRYLQGLGYLEVQSATGSLVTQQFGMRLDGDGEVRRAEGGSGFSLDFGASVVLNKQWSAGFSLINLGKISWNDNARDISGTMGVDSLRASDLSDVQDFDDLFNPEDQEQSLESFSSSIPTLIRAGVARRSDRWLAALDWEQGLNSSAGSTTRPRISTGGEYLVNSWLPIRGGISIGGREGITYALGFGLGRKLIVFDLALRLRRGTVPNTASGIGVSTELKLGF